MIGGDFCNQGNLEQSLRRFILESCTAEMIVKINKMTSLSIHRKLACFSRFAS